MTRILDEVKQELNDASNDILLPSKFRDFLSVILGMERAQSSEKASQAMLLPTYRLARAFEEFLKQDYNGAITEGGRVCEATLKPLYVHIFGHVPKAKKIHELAIDFCSQTKIQDERLKIILPGLWLTACDMRSKKVEPLNEEKIKADAIVSLVNSIYLTVVYYELLFEAISPDPSALNKLNAINAYSLLFESVKGILDAPTLPASIPDLESSMPLPEAIMKLLRSSYAILRGGLIRNEIIAALQYRKYSFSSEELSESLYDLQSRGTIRRSEVKGEGNYFIT